MTGTVWPGFTTSELGEIVKVPAQGSPPLAETAGEAIAIAIAGTDQAAPLRSVRLLAPAPSTGWFWGSSMVMRICLQAKYQRSSMTGGLRSYGLMRAGLFDQRNAYGTER